MHASTPLVPSIIDDQLNDLDSYDVHVVVGKTPEAALRAAQGLGLEGWPSRASREDHDGRKLWVHRYTRPKEACHA